MEFTFSIFDKKKTSRTELLVVLNRWLMIKIRIRWWYFSLFVCEAFTSLYFTQQHVSQRQQHKIKNKIKSKTLWNSFKTEHTRREMFDSADLIPTGLSTLLLVNVFLWLFVLHISSILCPLKGNSSILKLKTKNISIFGCVKSSPVRFQCDTTPQARPVLPVD